LALGVEHNEFISLAKKYFSSLPVSPTPIPPSLSGRLHPKSSGLELGGEKGRKREGRRRREEGG
jgi:hypothetical protein